MPGRGSEQAALLLESYVGLEAGDYGNVEQLSRKLREAQQERGALAGLEANNRANFLRTLADALRSVPGRGSEEAALLLESYLEVPIAEFAAAPIMRDVIPLNRLSFLQVWLRCVQPSDERLTVACRAIIDYVRKLRNETFPTYGSRREFFNEARKIVTNIQAATLRRVAQLRKMNRQQEAELLLRELLWWRDQFKNRLLIERMFLDAMPLGGDGGSQLQDWQPGIAAFLANDSHPITSQNQVASWACCLRTQDVAATESTDTPVVSANTAASRRFERLQSVEQLEAVLPERAMIVNTLIDEDSGRILWHAWQRTGDDIKLLAEGTSPENASIELSLANTRFDLAVERIWLAYEGISLPSEQIRSLLEALVLFAQQPELVDSLLPDESRFEEFIQAVYSILIALRSRAPHWVELGMHFLGWSTNAIQTRRSLQLGWLPIF